LVSARKENLHVRSDKSQERGAVWSQEADRLNGRGTISKRSSAMKADDYATSGKVTFYFANIPDFMPLFRLRQYFEVCGILSDVYVARHLNARGQVYGFVRFLNVKNRDKLGQSLE
jgi:hypothetical protein